MGGGRRGADELRCAFLGPMRCAMSGCIFLGRREGCAAI